MKRYFFRILAQLKRNVFFSRVNLVKAYRYSLDFLRILTYSKRNKF